MKAEKYRWHYLDFYMQHRILMIIIMWHNVICINLWISFSCNALRRCKENNYNVTEYHGLFWLWKCNSTRNFFKRLGGKDKALETRVKISRYFQFPFFFPLDPCDSLLFAFLFRHMLFDGQLHKHNTKHNMFITFYLIKNRI